MIPGLALIRRLPSSGGNTTLPLSLGETVERLGVRRDRVRNQASVDLPRSHIDIPHIVAKLMVAGIITWERFCSATIDALRGGCSRIEEAVKALACRSPNV